MNQIENCLFCQIAAKKKPAKIVGESQLAIAFNDINPKAPVHILIVPKNHSEKPSELSNDELSAMFGLSQKMAKLFDIEKSGYRLIFNVGRHAGQEIEHVHLHLLGGRDARAFF